MLSTAIRLHHPVSLAEAAVTRTELGDESCYLAGGTEIILLMKLGLADYPHLISLGAIAELARLEVAANGDLVLGAGVTHQRIADSGVVAQFAPEFARLEGRLANLRVRSSGTVAGNLAFADPHSDTATFLVAAGAQLVCRALDGTQRTVPVTEFMTAPFETVLGEGELICEIRLPAGLADCALAHHRIESQHQRPMVTLSCVLRSGPGGEIADVAVAAGSLCPRPVRLAAVEDALRGSPVGALHGSLLAEACAAASAEVVTADDAEGSADYKRHLAGVLVGRALTAVAQGSRPA